MQRMAGGVGPHPHQGLQVQAVHSIPEAVPVSSVPEVRLTLLLLRTLWDCDSGVPEVGGDYKNSILGADFTQATSVLASSWAE